MILLFLLVADVDVVGFGFAILVAVDFFANDVAAASFFACST